MRVRLLGTQACRILRDEGIRVILVNSNPATIMTDPEFADATYVEPITPEIIEKIIAIERPDAILPTLGGQTALNAAMALNEAGTLDRYNVELIGAKVEAIEAGKTASSSRRSSKQSTSTVTRRNPPRASFATPSMSVSPRWKSSDTRWWCDPHSRWVAQDREWRMTRTTYAESLVLDLRQVPRRKCC